MPDIAILGQVALGYSPFIDSKRAVSATRLSVFPLRPDAALDVAQLLHAVGDVWPASGGNVLAQPRQREPAPRPAAVEPERQPLGRGAELHGDRRGQRLVARAPARGRQRAAAQGPPERPAAARGAAVLQVLDHRHRRRPAHRRGRQRAGGRVAHRSRTCSRACAPWPTWRRASPAAPPRCSAGRSTMRSPRRPRARGRRRRSPTSRSSSS